MTNKIPILSIKWEMGEDVLQIEQIIFFFYLLEKSLSDSEYLLFSLCVCLVWPKYVQ